MPRRSRVPKSSALPAVAAGKTLARGAGWRWVLWHRRDATHPWTRQTSGVIRPRAGTIGAARRAVEREVAWRHRDQTRWALTFAAYPDVPSPPAVSAPSKPAR